MRIGPESHYHWFLQPILVAATILIALMVALYLTVNHTLNNLEKEYAETLDIHVSKLRHLDEMLRTAQHRHVVIHSIALLEDPFEREELIQEHAELALEYVQARDMYLALPMDEEEHQNNRQLLEYNRQGYHAQLEIIDALQRDLPSQKIIQLINFQLTPVLGEMYQFMVKMREGQVASARRAEQRVKDNMKLGQQRILHIYISAIVFSFIVIILAYRLQSRHQKQLTWLAAHDALTGLYNRYAFESFLDESIQNVINHHNEHVVLYVDLDQFKLINDTVGHQAGDEMLRQIATRLQKLIPGHAVLARMGGDEFGILIESGNEAQAIQLAEQILADLKDFQFVWVNNFFQTTASIGVVVVDETTLSRESLLSALDLACYAAKEQGRNRFHVFHESDEETNFRRGEMYWATKVRDALKEKRLVLYSQPILLCNDSYADSDEQYHEILVRLQERNGKIITPENFIQAAERYDLCPLVDMEVLDRFASYIKQSDDRKTNYSINLSGKSIVSEELLNKVLETLDKTGIDPSRLCFEITETAAIANLTAATRFMGILSQRGCRFSLDDFGSGLSSFSYLRELPVDFVKIDASFVRNISTSPTDLAIVSAMNEVAHALGLRTIAEGIEDAKTLETVKKIGIDYAQGFYIAMPGPLHQQVA